MCVHFMHFWCGVLGYVADSEGHHITFFQASIPPELCGTCGLLDQHDVAVCKHLCSSGSICCEELQWQISLS